MLFRCWTEPAPVSSTAYASSRPSRHASFAGVPAWSGCSRRSSSSRTTTTRAGCSNTCSRSRRHRNGHERVRAAQLRSHRRHAEAAERGGDRPDRAPPVEPGVSRVI